jgi:hypothetical protein
MTNKPIPPTTGSLYKFVELDEKGMPIKGTKVSVQARGRTDKRTLDQMKADDAASPWKKEWNPEDSAKGKYSPPTPDKT